MLSDEKAGKVEKTVASDGKRGKIAQAKSFSVELAVKIARVFPSQNHSKYKIYTSRSHYKTALTPVKIHKCRNGIFFIQQ